MMLCCLWSSQVAWAQNVEETVDENAVAFLETFEQNPNKGGRDGNYGQGSSVPVYDNAGWDGSNTEKIYGAHECIRFGTTSDEGTCTSPVITLIDPGRQAVLTFDAAGWNGTVVNKVRVSGEGITFADPTEITLTNSEWKTYTIRFTASTPEIRLTFTGKRGFLDDVKVTEIITEVAAPALTDDFNFFPNTTEAPEKLTTLVPSVRTTAIYTTDGSEPSLTNGTHATLTNSIKLTATTTVKAIAYIGNVVSSKVTKTYTLGNTVNSIAEFVALSEGTEARLYLSDELMARVLNVSEKQFTLKDNTGTLLVNFGETPYSPTPEKDMHLAGWLVGQKTTIGGQPAMVATHNTNAYYMAFAQPVTELPTSVKNIQREQFDAQTEYYNLNGQRVAQPGKGIYITNGKKEVRK